MRALLLAAIATLGSACGADGVFIEVQRPPGMPGDRVQLLIADRGCQLDGVPCESMQPEGFGQPIFDAQVFFRDALDEYVADFEGDTATFQLEVKDKRLPVVIAIASRPSDMGREITGIAIMRNTIDLSRDPIRYEVVLGPPNAMRPLVAWPDGAPTLQCVGVRDADGTSLFLVPAEDPDCDNPFLDQAGITECAPLAFLGVGVGDTACLTEEQNTAVCTLGAVPTCDEMGTQTTCVGGGPICMPSTVCAACDELDLACAVGELKTSPVRVTCTLPSEISAQNSLVSCDPARPTLIEPLAGFDCKSAPELADLNDPIHTSSNTVEFGPTASVRIVKFDPTCLVQVDWEGEVAGIGPSSLESVLHVEVLQPSTGRSRELLLPVSFKLDPVLVPCENGVPSCTIENASTLDSMFECTK